MPEITLKLGDTIVHRYTFDKDVFSVGRAKDNDVTIETLSVSRNHARIRREGDRYILTDLHSANGTYVNGVKVSKTEVMDEDVITVGKHKLLFSLKSTNDEQAINDAFGAERTIMMDANPVGVLIVTRGKMKDQEFAVDRYETTIGRSAECQVRIHDWFVGKKHAVIYREGGKLTVKDLGKLAGVSVNDQVVRDSRRLNDGDVIKIGPVLMSFNIRSSQAMMASSGRKPIEIAYDEAAVEEPIQAPAPEEESWDSLIEEDLSLSSPMPEPPAEKEPELEEEIPIVDLIEDEESFPSDFEETATPGVATQEIPAVADLDEALSAAQAGEEAEPSLFDLLDDEEGDQTVASIPEQPAPAPEPAQASLDETPMGEPVAIAESLAAEAVLTGAEEPAEDFELDLADLAPSEEPEEPAPAEQEPEPPEPEPLEPEEDLLDEIEEEGPPIEEEPQAEAAEPEPEEEPAAAESPAEETPEVEVDAEAAPEAADEEPTIEEEAAEEEPSVEEPVEETPAEQEAVEAEEEAPEEEPKASADENLEKQVALWERALRNPSPVIQREAIRRLKKLTGKDYEG